MPTGGSSDFNDSISDRVSSTRIDPVRISDDSSRERRATRLRRQNAFDIDSVDIDLEEPASESPSTVSYDQPNNSGGESQLTRTRNKSRRINRYHPFDLAIRQIRQIQSTTTLLIPRQPFERLVREIAQPMGPELRFRGEAIDALQESAEPYLIHLFQDSILSALHGKRLTTMLRDLQLVMRIREREQQRKACDINEMEY
ncbi:AAEL004001-PA [Aedes aegypti]|uniref:AAEL004001-PA n=1 Tax=Aedes aegypti TaxID=7159 RepID=Q17DZ3_AEDAE|nr:AAEL004001-PA [Aedes aegypti]